jgi:hypothetical protein
MPPLIASSIKYELAAPTFPLLGDFTDSMTENVVAMHGSEQSRNPAKLMTIHAVSGAR